MSEFFQDGPVLTNQYTSDRLLQSYLKMKLPAEVFAGIESDLINLGERVVTDLYSLAKEAEAQEPELVSYDPWGRRIDEIKVSRAWKDLDRVSAEEGMVATGYERTFAEFSRIYQFAKLYLFNPSSAIYTCPLAMTDGAARLIEVYGDEKLKNNAYKHLTSRDPAFFWTSGQWMTEKTGGSDVGRTETVAKLEGGHYRLYGVKWFTSATTSQMAMTLARIVNPDGSAVEGSRGLSLFYLELRDANGKLNNITINRLKDKLGTRALPTAELTLNGTIAELVGGPGNGIKKIATLFNVTRIYNANSSIALMRRAIALLRDYSLKREAFGKKLADHPLHYETLAQLETEFQGSFLLSFYTVELLGKEECGKATEEESKVLRLLTPLVKLFTAKQAVGTVSEVVELFGGAGYIEDTGIPALLRDTQVLSIWEGTTNILSLDSLRAIKKENTLYPFIKNIEQRVGEIQNPELLKEKGTIIQALIKLQDFVREAAVEGESFTEASARSFAFSLSRVFSASLLLEHAEWQYKNENNRKGIVIAKRWFDKDLIPLIYPNNQHLLESRAIALDADI